MHGIPRGDVDICGVLVPFDQQRPACVPPAKGHVPGKLALEVGEEPGGEPLIGRFQRADEEPLLVVVDLPVVAGVSRRGDADNGVRAGEPGDDLVGVGLRLVGGVALVAVACIVRVEAIELVVDVHPISEGFGHYGMGLDQIEDVFHLASGHQFHLLTLIKPLFPMWP